MSRKKNVKEKEQANQSLANELVDLGILSELASIGAGHAATSLSEILQQKVLIGVPRIHNVPAYLLPKIFGLHEMLTTALYIRLTGRQECDILLMLEVDEARKLAAMMAMTPSIADLDPEMEASAVEELANILVGSFLSAISDFLAVKLMPMAPDRIVDAFDAILDTVLVKNSLESSETLIFDISFRTAERTSTCMLLLFPSPALQRMLVQKSQGIVETYVPTPVSKTNTAYIPG